MAALYGPSTVEYGLGGGLSVRIVEETAYPFEEQVRFTFRFFRNGAEVSTPVPMDFTYRIPFWCTSAREKGFHTVSRSWVSGESFTVQLPMQVEQVETPGGGLLRGRVLGVDGMGLLRLQGDDGAVTIVTAGDVHLRVGCRSRRDLSADV